MSPIDEQEAFLELEKLFDLTCGLSDSERALMLEQLEIPAGTQQRLARMIEVASSPEPEIDLRSAGAATLAALDHEESISLLGRVTGPFRLTRLLAMGGVGAVYQAERIGVGEPRIVAVKLLAPHAAGPDFARRFVREHQHQARLDHPHIARLIESGVSGDGQPYLALEFVDGQPVDVFCDEARLSLRQRLGLLLQVCEALSYAHRNLLLHLDIKPTNILVTGEGSVKVLDFGTSRLMLPESPLATAAFATPAYASPEQLRDEALATTCDVYSLGAVMYELLGGLRPFPASTVVGTMERVYQEQEPPALDAAALTDEAAHARGLTSASRLRLALRGDLAMIAAKCLRARAEERYSSVDALAADLRRYLDGREVLARPRTAIHRLGKFLRRHAAAVAATAVVVLLLGVALGYDAQRRREAASDLARAQDASSFVYLLLATANPNFTGKPDTTVPELIEHAAELAPTVIHNPQDLYATQLALAESMIHAGDTAGADKTLRAVRTKARDPGFLIEADAFLSRLDAQAGKMDEAMSLSQQALDLSHGPAINVAERVWADIAYAEVRENGGQQTAQDLELLREAVRLAQPPQVTPYLHAEAQYALASDLELRGNLTEAEALIRDDLAIYQQQPNSLCHQSQMYADLGFIVGSRNDAAGSVPLFEKAFEGSRACAGPDVRATLSIEDFLAGAMLHAGDAASAARVMQDALPRWKKQKAGGTDLLNALYYTASAQLGVGHLKEAEATTAELLTEAHRVVPPQSHIAGSCEQVTAEVLMREGRFRDALPHAQTAAAVLARTASSPGTTAQSQKAAAELVEIERHTGKS